jgi:hypothetical protein
MCNSHVYYLALLRSNPNIGEEDRHYPGSSEWQVGCMSAEYMHKPSSVSPTTLICACYHCHRSWQS